MNRVTVNIFQEELSLVASVELDIVVHHFLETTFI